MVLAAKHNDQEMIILMRMTRKKREETQAEHHLDVYIRILHDEFS